MLARYRAGRWRSAFDPADFPTTAQINDVYAAPGREVRAVGGVGTEPLVLARSTGLDFVRETAPTIGRGTSLNAVGAGQRYYAVGVYTGTDAWAHPAAYRLAGGQWRSEQVSEGFGNPQAVAVDPDRPGVAHGRLGQRRLRPDHAPRRNSVARTGRRPTRKPRY